MLTDNSKIFSFYAPGIVQNQVQCSKIKTQKSGHKDGADYHYTFSSKFAGKRANQILEDVDCFLSSPQTNTWDGVVFRRLLSSKFANPYSSCIDSDLKKLNTQAETNYQNSRYQNFKPSLNFTNPTGLNLLKEHYTEIVEGLFNHKTKNIALKLMYQGIISREAYQNILNKSSSRYQLRSADVLLDTLLKHPPTHKFSRDQVASAFKRILIQENFTLASKIYSK